MVMEMQWLVMEMMPNHPWILMAAKIGALMLVPPSICLPEVRFL
jgi:hypothetical protein